MLEFVFFSLLSVAAFVASMVFAARQTRREAEAHKQAQAALAAPLDVRSSAAIEEFIRCCTPSRAMRLSRSYPGAMIPVPAGQSIPEAARQIEMANAFLMTTSLLADSDLDSGQRARLLMAPNPQAVLREMAAERIRQRIEREMELELRRRELNVMLPPPILLPKRNPEPNLGPSLAALDAATAAEPAAVK